MCNIILCQSGLPGTIDVNENISDGSFVTSICTECAGVLSIKAGADIPDNTNQLLRKHYKVPTGWRPGDSIHGKPGTSGLRTSKKPNTKKKKAPVAKKPDAAVTT